MELKLDILRGRYIKIAKNYTDNIINLSIMHDSSINQLALLLLGIQDDEILYNIDFFEENNFYNEKINNTEKNVIIKLLSSMANLKTENKSAVIITKDIHSDKLIYDLIKNTKKGIVEKEAIYSLKAHELEEIIKMDKIESVISMPLNSSLKNQIIIFNEEKVNKNNQVLNNFSIGSCAPAPLWDMISLFGRFYPEKYILHKIENNLQLFEKLKNDIYQMIILSEPIDNSEFFCIKYKTEQLFLSVPLQHPLAKKKEIHFSDITDDRMLLFNPIGIWKDVVLEKMPNMNFLIQSDRIIYQELAEMQNLLHFRSNFTLEREDNFKNNISIPIADKEAKMTFYCVCKKDIKNEIEKLFDNFSENS